MSVDFELNLAGLNDLMKSAEMQQILGAACSEVAANAGKGFDYRVGVGSFAAIGNVFAEDKESAALAYKDNRLLKALGSTTLEM